MDSVRWNHAPRRLPGHDYSQAGFYFVTICTQGRRPFLQPLDAQLITRTVWLSLAGKFPYLRLDRFAIRPDHVHFLIALAPPVAPSSPDSKGAAQFPCADASPIGRSFHVDPRRPTLGQVVRAFKATVTRRMHLAGTPAFGWQRNYFEWVIRDDAHLQRTREYIRRNLPGPE